MRLDIRAADRYEPERRYILDVVLSQWLGLEWRLQLEDRPDVHIALAGDERRCLLTPDALFATARSEWMTPASLPRAPLAWREATPRLPNLPATLPVLYGRREPNGSVLECRADVVELSLDVFGSCFFMLTRYEEIVVQTRDRYGRFPASACIAERERFLATPVVDAYVEVLWSALRQLWPGLERKRRRFEIALSHDVDRPLAAPPGRPASALARQLAADALLRRDVGVAGRRVRSWVGRRRGDFRLDPFNTFDYLMDVSEAHGLTSSFYFLATDTATELDGLYTLDQPWIESVLRRVHDRGHEIGLHASFHSYRDGERTQEEFARLRRAVERNGIHKAHWGGRQHYLRWENPTTWENWDAAGLDYDCTLGYADRIGFRLGTAHEFPVFHLLERRRLRLRERPLHVMDGTLFGYMRLAPGPALDAVLAVARECRRYGGTLGLLWHNSSLPAAHEKRWYEALLRTLCGLAWP